MRDYLLAQDFAKIKLKIVKKQTLKKRNKIYSDLKKCRLIYSYDI